MRFCLEVGNVERHLVEYTFSQLLGQLHIRVDNKEVKKRFCFINEPITETHTIRVGDCERIDVRFEKERISTFSQKCRVFINDRLYKCFEGV